MAAGCRIERLRFDLFDVVLARSQPGNCGSEVSVGRVPELGDERMALEGSLDDPALHTDAATVHEAHLAQAGFVRRSDVLVDDRSHVARVERMEIDHRLNRQSYRVVHGMQDAG